MIGRAIESVLNQTYKNFEIIVVDDASRDDTEEVVNSFNDSHIRYIRHQKNKGAAAARNTGIKASWGEFIAFQDSDDEWLPEKLEEQMEMFETTASEVGVNYTALWKIRRDKKFYLPSPKMIPKEGYISDKILEGRSYVDTPCAIVKKQVFKKVGMFDENTTPAEDWEFWIRVSQYYQFQYIDKPLVISYYTPGSISTDRRDQVKASRIILKKHSDKFERNKEAMANILFNIGNNLCQIGKIVEGRKYLIKSMKLDRKNIVFLIATLASFFGKSVYREVSRMKKKMLG